MASEDSTPLILDCTLRDGGYINKWRFPRSVVLNHTKLAAQAGADLIEIGYRKEARETAEYLGSAAFCPPDLIAEIRAQIPTAKLGVMVNQAEVNGQPDLRTLFSEESSKLDFARLACRLEDIPEASQSAAQLVDQGMAVFANLMQVGQLSRLDVLNARDSLLDAGLSGFYLADSFGSMRPEQVLGLVRELTSTADLPIGVHFHDQLGLAFANALAALSAGARFVDGTVLGMGRGAGNTKLEDLVLELKKDKAMGPGLPALIDFWQETNQKSADRMEWGRTVEYGLAAAQEVHPSYVQDLLQSEEFSRRERIAVVRELGRISSSRYSPGELNVGASWFEDRGTSSEAVDRLFHSKEVLLVGTGKSVETYGSDIEAFIEERHPLILLVGNHAHDPFVSDYRVVCNPLTFMVAEERLLGHLPTIGPLSQVPEIYMSSPNSRDLSIDVSVGGEVFGLEGNTLRIPSARSSVFAMFAASEFGADTIYLAGFDGYPSLDARNHEFQRAIRHAEGKGLRVISIGPSGFDLPFSRR